MSESNPYQYTPTDDGEKELLDDEARQRIMESLQASHGPLRRLAVAIALIAALFILLVLFSGGMGLSNLSRGKLKDLASFAMATGIPLTLGIAAFVMAGWLWSCSVAINRAGKRLTVASLASAVQAQSLFWKKLSNLAVIVIVVVVSLIVGLYLVQELT